MDQPLETEFHYYSVCDLTNNRVPVTVVNVLPDTRIPENLKFKVVENGLEIKPGTKFTNVKNGEKIISQGQRVSFPEDELGYSIEIDPSTFVTFWTTKINPERWSMIQPYHRFAKQ